MPRWRSPRGVRENCLSLSGMPSLRAATYPRLPGSKNPQQRKLSQGSNGTRTSSMPKSVRHEGRGGAQARRTGTNAGGRLCTPPVLGTPERLGARAEISAHGQQAEGRAMNDKPKMVEV